jgi:hypothetical protein
MTIDVFLCHAPVDRELAQRIATRLERTTEARVILDECNAAEADTVANRWDAGLSSTAILLLLSAASVPARLSREDWDELLKHVQAGGSPHVYPIIVSPCKYPSLLTRSGVYDCDNDALRQIGARLIALHPPPAGRPFMPADLTGVTADLAPLWASLVDESGVVHVGDSRAAQAFARAARSHFRDVFWLSCVDRSRESIVGDLGAQLGISMECSAKAAAEKVGAALDNHRVLVILDGLSTGLPFPRSVDARSSVIVCDGPRLPDISPPDDPLAARLWNAACACAANDFPIPLAGRIAGLSREDGRIASAALTSSRHVEPIDDARRRYRRASGRTTMQREHASAIAEMLSETRRDPEQSRLIVAELPRALDWALTNSWQTAVTLGKRGCTLLKAMSRWPEAATVCHGLMASAMERGDSATYDEFAWELSWLDETPQPVVRAFNSANQLAFDY